MDASTRNTARVHVGMDVAKMRRELMLGDEPSSVVVIGSKRLRRYGADPENGRRRQCLT